MKEHFFGRYLLWWLLPAILVFIIMSMVWVQLDNLNSLAAQIKNFDQQVEALPPATDPLSRLDLEKGRLILEKDRVTAQNNIYSALLVSIGGGFGGVAIALSLEDKK